MQNAKENCYVADCREEEAAKLKVHMHAYKHANNWLNKSQNWKTDFRQKNAAIVRGKYQGGSRARSVCLPRVIGIGKGVVNYRKSQRAHARPEKLSRRVITRVISAIANGRGLTWVLVESSGELLLPPAQRRKATKHYREYIGRYSACTAAS